MHLNPYRLLFVAVFLLASCTKNNVAPADPQGEKPVVYKDSVSFTINQAEYVFNNRYSIGVGSRAVNIKPYNNKIANGKLAYETGGRYWYGVPDSTLYSVEYGFSGRGSQKAKLSLIFSKKCADRELIEGPAGLLFAANNTLVLKTGAWPFATDFDKENTRDGVVIVFQNGKTYTTAIPGFSILVNPNLTNDIQNDSSFEVTKVEKINENKYLVEARFELNLYDEDGNKSRLKNGFIKFTTSVKPVNGILPL